MPTSLWEWAIWIVALVIMYSGLGQDDDDGGCTPRSRASKRDARLPASTSGSANSAGRADIFEEKSAAGLREIQPRTTKCVLSGGEVPLCADALIGLLIAVRPCLFRCPLIEADHDER
jgi:hypothetical protein